MTNRRFGIAGLAGTERSLRRDRARDPDRDDRIQYPQVGEQTPDFIARPYQY